MVRGAFRGELKEIWGGSWGHRGRVWGSHLVVQVILAVTQQLRCLPQILHMNLRVELSALRQFQL